MTVRMTAEPPEILFCAVETSKCERTYRQGLNRSKMASVALYDNPESARRSLGRKSNVSVFAIVARVMVEDGFVFYRSPENLWHTTEIPPKYLRFQ